MEALSGDKAFETQQPGLYDPSSTEPLDLEDQNTIRSIAPPMYLAGQASFYATNAGGMDIAPNTVTLSSQNWQDLSFKPQGSSYIDRR